MRVRRPKWEVVALVVGACAFWPVFASATTHSNVGPAPVPDRFCNASVVGDPHRVFGSADPVCWTAVTDSVLTVGTVIGPLQSRYAVLSVDGSELHRNRFADGFTRIALRAGESLQLLSEANDVTVTLKAVRPLAEVPKPGSGERCVAAENANGLCFAVSSRN